jgi:hypothetical protein
VKNTKQEIAIGTLRGAIAAIPFAGGALNEAIFDIRSRIKQARINAFVEYLAQYFENHAPTDAQIGEMKTEEFSDLIESIFVRVARNRSDKKLDMYRNILVTGLNGCEPQIKAETFLDVLERVEPIHLEILKFFGDKAQTQVELRMALRKKVESLPIMEKQRGLPNEIAQAEREYTLHALEEGVGVTKNYQQNLEEFELSVEKKVDDLLDFRFYYQDMIAKSLLIDVGSGFSEEPPLRFLQITNYGLDFLRFVIGSSRRNSGDTIT